MDDYTLYFNAIFREKYKPDFNVSFNFEAGSDVEARTQANAVMESLSMDFTVWDNGADLVNNTTGQEVELEDE